jgi:hypothetical protein
MGRGWLQGLAVYISKEGLLLEEKMVRRMQRAGNTGQGEIDKGIRFLGGTEISLTGWRHWNI